MYVFTPAATSWKTFRRLAKEKGTLDREIDKGKNCWNFAWHEENVTVPGYLERNNQRTLNVCWRLHRLWQEIDLPRKVSVYRLPKWLWMCNVCWWASGCLSPFTISFHHWLTSWVQHHEKESRVSVSPYQWIASRHQVLCSAFSWQWVLQGAERPWHWICKGDFCTTQPNGGTDGREGNSQRLWKWIRLYKTYVTQRWIRRNRRKRPTSATWEKAAQVKFCPNGREGGRQHTQVYMTQLWNR